MASDLLPPPVSSLLIETSCPTSCDNLSNKAHLCVSFLCRRTG
jgi:hypothetical protein